MTKTEPLPLYHSWPLFQMAEQVPALALSALQPGGWDSPSRVGTEKALSRHGIGLWACDLRDNALRWSLAVYEIFGLSPGNVPQRNMAVSLYAPHSRSAMEELRAHAIRHRRGFTLDAQIVRPSGEPRWMRLTAIPVLSDNRVVRLCGTKQDVTAQISRG